MGGILFLFFFLHSPVADHLFRRIFRALWGDSFLHSPVRNLPFEAFFFSFRKDFQGLCGRLQSFPLRLESSLINFFEEYVGLCGRNIPFLHSPVRKFAFRGFFFFSFRKDNSKGILWEAAKLSTPPGSF